MPLLPLYGIAKVLLALILIAPCRRLSVFVKFIVNFVAVFVPVAIDDAVARAADRGRDDVAGANAGGGDDEPGPGEFQETELLRLGRFRHAADYDASRQEMKRSGAIILDSPRPAPDLLDSC